MHCDGASRNKTWKSSISVTPPATSVSPRITFAPRESGPRTALTIITALLLTLTTLLPTTARAEWREATSEHFVIVSESNERQLIELSQRLEAVHWLLTQATNRREAAIGQRVRVYMVANPAAVRSAVGVPSNSAMIAVYFRNPVMPVALAARDRPPSDLFHEYGHHFMYQYMPRRFPHWFVEGFAEVVSTASFEIDGRITYGKVANERRFELREGSWTPLERMFAEPGEDEEGSGGGHAGVASYGQYWVTTHYLLFAPERRGQLGRYIAAITNGEDSLAAAETAFPGGLEQLDRDVRAYLRRADFQYRPVPLPEGVMRTPSARLLRSSETAALRLEMESARTWSTEGNAALLPRVAALAAQHPGEPTVHALHSWVLTRTEAYSEAMTAADRGIAVDPAHARSLALRAYAEYRALTANDGGLPEADFDRIRSLVDRARTSDRREPALRLLPMMGSATVWGPAPETGEPRLTPPRTEPPSVITPDQARRYWAAIEMVENEDAGASSAFSALAQSATGTPLAEYANAWAAWLAGGQPGPAPGHDQRFRSTILAIADATAE